MVLGSLVLLLLPASGAPLASVVGEVVEPAAPGARQMRVRDDAGTEVAVAFDDATAFLRAKPGATTLAGAETVRAADVAKGDRVLCQGAPGDDGAPMRARRVVVMARADVDAARQRQREEWRRRGISGVVTAVDPAKRELTLRLPAAAGASEPSALVVDASAPSVVFRRYAAGSLRFADARPGTFGELAVGDQVRVLGSRDPDGRRVAAEQVVSGSFRIVRGVLKQSAEGVLAVQEEGKGGGLVAVSVAEGALVRRLPPFVVMRLLRTDMGGAGSPGGPETAGGPAGVGGGRGMNADEMLERLPAVTVAELKPGEEVAALGARGPDATRLEALKLVAWTVPESTPASARGSGRGGMGGGPPADPFSDLLGATGDSSW